jgi:hypothetical protein
VGARRRADPATSDPGRICLWLDIGKRAARASALPYSRALHEQVQLLARAHTRAAPGRTQSSSGRRSLIRFYPHPPVRLPPKTH